MIRAGSRVVYEFGGYRLDPRQQQLLRADGQLVSLTPRVFDTVVCLIEHRGELLDKATLQVTGLVHHARPARTRVPGRQ